MRTALYRHFDRFGGLLYVGISVNPFHRTEQHAQKALWFKEIADIRIEWCDSREEAEIAERQAIMTERPFFNIRHNVEISSNRERLNLLVVGDLPNATNEVAMACFGEPLDRVFWRGIQWAVTAYGLEDRKGRYAIKSARLCDLDWTRHIAQKIWADSDDFRVAYAVARHVHSVALPGDPIPSGAEVSSIVEQHFKDRPNMELVTRASLLDDRAKRWSGYLHEIPRAVDLADLLGQPVEERDSCHSQ